jgi:predicted phage terminase large subunit-like protein
MNLLVSPQEAARALMQRRSIRSNIDSWCRFAGYEPARHHLALNDRLQALASGEVSRLAIFMPPGSAKSTYGSVLFPPWFMAAAPESQVLVASHTSELAEKWGRRVRNLIADHPNVLGISLKSDSTAAGRWALNEGGEYYAAGVGVGIAGFRADLAIIDDPIRSRADADSTQVRDKIWDWYKSDLSPRLKPNNRVVLIQTRWHEDDLAGRLLTEMAAGGEHWEVLSLPAEAESDDPLGRAPGEWLWDDAYGYGNLLREAKKNQLPRNWSALYQQQPTPDTGDYFKADWLKPYDQAPAKETLTVYGGSDYAVTDNGGDYTVHVVVGIDPEDRMYLLDLWRGQKQGDVWIDAFCDLVIEWNPMGWAEEMGQIKAAIGPFLARRQHERKAYVAREQFTTRTGNKAVRAQSIRGRMALSGLYVPVHAPWYAALRAELLSFPAGKHDDQVDALGLVGQLLDKMIIGRKPKKAEPDKRDAYREARDDAYDESTATL